MASLCYLLKRKRIKGSPFGLRDSAHYTYPFIQPVWPLKGPLHLEATFAPALSKRWWVDLRVCQYLSCAVPDRSEDIRNTMATGKPRSGWSAMFVLETLVRLLQRVLVNLYSFGCHCLNAGSLANSGSSARDTTEGTKLKKVQVKWHPQA